VLLLRPQQRSRLLLCSCQSLLTISGCCRGFGWTERTRSRSRAGLLQTPSSEQRLVPVLHVQGRRCPNGASLAASSPATQTLKTQVRCAHVKVAGLLRGCTRVKRT
jgi:hypothetical protein